MNYNIAYFILKPYQENTILESLSELFNLSYEDIYKEVKKEFASRGCTDIVSVEMNPLHAKFIKQVATAYKVKGMQVVRHNVFEFINICTKKFDIVFADPPYSIEGLDTIPDKVFEKGLVNVDGYLILEHPGTYNFEEHPYFVKERKYGNVHFSFFRQK